MKRFDKAKMMRAFATNYISTLSKNNTEIACGLYKSGYSILTFHKEFSADILILVSKQKQSFLFYVVFL